MAPRRTSSKAKSPRSKGSRAQSRGPGPGRVTPRPSPRYTPPIPKEQKVSPRWVPVLMLSLLVLGLLTIVGNYLGLLPGEASNLYLLLGLGFITLGFITATRYR